MAKPAIRVEGLWKEYVIGAQQKAHGTFYDMLSSSLAAPFRALRKRTTEEQEAESFWALRDVNFEVQPGEVVGIIGRNGAGKSTLLKILSRITAPTRGHVEVRGRLASLLEVGTGFHPELSGRENIFLNGAILGMKRSEVVRKFDEIVAFAEIEKFVDTQVKRYSSGMYVRLAFAVAAHLESDVLIVDEVLAVGDASFQMKCLSKMEGMAKTGRTVLFVTHNMGAVTQLCQRGVLLGNGAVHLDGTTNHAIAEYLSSGLETASSRSYSRDVLKRVQVLAIAVKPSSGPVGATVRHTDGISLTVDYWVDDWPKGAYACVDVCRDSGEKVLWTCDVETADEMAQVRACGKYRATVVVPGGICSPGRYYFTFAFFAPGRGEVYDVADRAVVIEIVDSGSLQAQLGIQTHALTSIQMSWTTQHLSEIRNEGIGC